MLKAYTDGSYNVKTGQYGFGIVILDDTEVLIAKSYQGCPYYAHYRNVAGEVDAVKNALLYALHTNSDITIYADYEGVIKWARGEWKCNNELTQGYKNLVDFVSSHIKVDFVKVKAHSGDFYNSMVDKLAKKGAGMK